MLEGARASRLFAHRLVCTLSSEGRPPAEAFSPAVKRSGWKPPRDTGLWDTADAVKAQVGHRLGHHLEHKVRLCPLC